MAQVDVTELLTDPDFVDEIKLVKRMSTVNAAGENVVTDQTFCSLGSVQSATGKTIQRLPEDMRVRDVRTFIVKGTITTDANGRYSDIIIFRGLRFTIITVNDWTNFGAGWCRGICVREVPAL